MMKRKGNKLTDENKKVIELSYEIYFPSNEILFSCNKSISM